MKLNFLFEISWEVCNKVGGIHTVIKSKSQHLLSYVEEVIFIGPDIQHVSHDNGEFIEDKSFFVPWKDKILNQPIRVRTGRWNIPGKPIVILVDFTGLIPLKNNILKELWEDFNVNSISGGWNYVEAVLFGYAAGKVIDSFYHFYLTEKKHVVAHFHEWMTGAGLLYLRKNTPSVATVFTTHSTCLGRSVCSNGQNLYKQLPSINPESKARELGIISQNSIEKITAHRADCFTTVSELTAKECKVILQREVDFVCPNGLNSLPFNENAKLSSREKILSVAEAITGRVSSDALLLATSGRYEYRNKGVDLFISVLDKLKNSNIDKEIIGFILIPTNSYGPNQRLKNKLEGKSDENLQGLYATHDIYNAHEDIIIRTFSHFQFKNDIHSKVKIFFTPVYLNGNDGIFDIPYYELLQGFDLSMFASYYEPWGYTPHESITLGVPTITSTLAGFGLWAKENSSNPATEGVLVIERNDKNYREATDTIVNFLKTTKQHKLTDELSEKACQFSKKASWDTFFENYKNGYTFALEKVNKRRETIFQKAPKLSEKPKQKHTIMTNTPVWTKITIEYNLPENLKFLDELSKNLWWTWNHEARKLFRMIDIKQWDEYNQNPAALLKGISIDKYNELEKDTEFLEKLALVKKQFTDYMNIHPQEDAPKIAYFSMEYGLTDVIKIYSGGLGILAGDYLKEASDSNINITGIGLLYRFGYFAQRLSIHGDQLADYIPQVFSELPIDYVRNEHGNHLTIDVDFPGRTIKARVWKVLVGRIKLYLLDTDDTPLNNEEDRTITHQLYGGSWENRLKQELLLGLGGVRLLEYLNIKPDVFHINEGHAAFLNLERMSSLIAKENITFDEALEIVRASSLFTTHTPVPAGHDAFKEDLLRTYLRHVPEQLKISWEDFLGLGRFNPDDSKEKFSMSIFAARTSQEINGVSKLHGEVTRLMFTDLWKGFAANELHIGHVTNGVHYNTWISHEWKLFHQKTFGKEYCSDISNPHYWEKIYEVPNKDIWEVRSKLRKRLTNYIRRRFQSTLIRRYEDPKILVEILDKLDEKHLTIGFARRFATYKRAHLLFNDLDRLSEIVNNKAMPISFVFSGKAHPHDKAGQDLIKNIIHISRRKEFIGKILYLENYDMQLAKRLVTGVDVWFNTPTRPLEASGTSGQKAAMNGVLNFSVLDGWWVEGYKEDAGWALSQHASFENNQRFQNQLDAASIYSIFENEIIPLFYQRDANGIPQKWIEYIKNSFAKIVPMFTTKRMIDDYNDKFYKKLYHRSKSMNANHYQLAFDIADWKRNINQNWDRIEVVNINFPNTDGKPYIIGKTYECTVVLNLHELTKEDIGVEMIFSKNKADFKKEVFATYVLLPINVNGNQVYYRVNFKLKRSGVYDWGLRIYPKNSKLPHRQDFPFVRFI